MRSLFRVALLMLGLTLPAVGQYQPAVFNTNTLEWGYATTAGPQVPATSKLYVPTAGFRADTNRVTLAHNDPNGGPNMAGTYVRNGAGVYVYQKIIYADTNRLTVTVTGTAPDSDFSGEYTWGGSDYAAAIGGIVYDGELVHVAKQGDWVTYFDHSSGQYGFRFANTLGGLTPTGHYDFVSAYDYTFFGTLHLRDSDLNTSFQYVLTNNPAANTVIAFDGTRWVASCDHPSLVYWTNNSVNITGTTFYAWGNSYGTMTPSHADVCTNTLWHEGNDAPLRPSGWSGCLTNVVGIYTQLVWYVNGSVTGVTAKTP